MENKIPYALTLLSKNIKGIRKEKRITQEYLAEKTDVTVKYISHIERGLSFPSADILGRIAIALDVPVYRLFFPDGSDGFTIPRDILKQELHRIIDELR